MTIAISTDLYQLTMAQGYWKLGKHTQRAVFDLFFRENPFQGGYAVCSGLEAVINAITQFAFTSAEIQYLASLCAANGTPLFEEEFLQALLALRLTVDLDAIPEGTLVFPKEPLLRVTGPLWECQLLETLLLNLMNFATLIATKSARICSVAGTDPVIEFGLRRAQGQDGGLTASRSAYVGGVASTSNVLAGCTFGIPVAGTHAHSWVMAFDTEKESFEAYARVMPNNCLFLVDTYGTAEGVLHAIEEGLKLENQGYQLLGIRLDSGDLLQLSIVARRLLDEAGLKNAVIVGSNDLDEYAIQKLKEGGAKISVWGVGTRLVTGYDQPALGGVYKLVAIENKKGDWQYKAKRTDDPEKQSLLGIHGVRRFSENNLFVRDVIYDIKKHDNSDEEFSPKTRETFEELLVPIFRQGKQVYHSPALSLIRERTHEQLQKLPAACKSLKPKSQYPVHLAKNMRVN